MPSWTISRLEKDDISGLCLGRTLITGVVPVVPDLDSNLSMCKVPVRLGLFRE